MQLKQKEIEIENRLQQKQKDLEAISTPVSEIIGDESAKGKWFAFEGGYKQIERFILLEDTDQKVRIKPDNE